eukprot:GDKJ01013417.1.p1 GENE.GDKJ01013417.1~~GDKJ01013417.1.p1  ORF type:complete len:734 (+),score=150.96 GDKJ01013417.1:293-2203(+)
MKNAHRRVRTDISQSPGQFKFRASDLFFDSPRASRKSPEENDWVDEKVNLSFSAIQNVADNSFVDVTPQKTPLSSSTNASNQPQLLGGQDKDSKDNVNAEIKTKSTDFLRAGSMKSSIFNLTSATLGAGALTIPYAFHTAGLLYSMTFLGIMAVISTVATLYIVQVMIQTGLQTFEELSLFAFGHRFAIIVELSIIIFCFGTATGYLITVGDIVMVSLNSFQVPQILADLMNQTDSASFQHLLITICEFLMRRESILVIVTFTLLLPLSLVDGLSKLSFTCVLGVIAISFLSVVVALRTFILGIEVDSFYEALFPPAAFSKAGDQVTVSSLSPLIRATSLLVFAFSCQTNVPTIYTELEKRNARRMTKVSIRALVLCAAVYSLIGVGGSLSFGKATEHSIVSNLENDLTITVNNSRISINDVSNNSNNDPEIPYVSHATHALMHLLVAIGFVGLIPAILFAYPLNIFPCRFALEAIIYHYLGGKSSGGSDNTQTSLHDENIVRRANSSSPVTTLQSPPPFGDSTEERCESVSENDSRSQNGNDDEEHTRFVQKTIATAVVLASLFAAIVMRNLDFVFALSGATAGAFSSVICPAILYIKLMPGEITTPKKIGACLMCAAGVGIAVIGTWDCVTSET